LGFVVFYGYFSRDLKGLGFKSTVWGCVASLSGFARQKLIPACHVVAELAD
jgi:hypothetical protein